MSRVTDFSISNSTLNDMDENVTGRIRHRLIGPCRTDPNLGLAQVASGS